MDLKNKIEADCIAYGHIYPTKDFCLDCTNVYKSKLSTADCNHQKLTYQSPDGTENFYTCEACHNDIINGIECGHSGSRVLTSLDAIAYNFRSVH